MPTGSVHERRHLLYRFAGLIIVCAYFPTVAALADSNIVCRPELAASHRETLAGKLRQITGWRDLDFDGEGILKTGDITDGGSATARQLLLAARRTRELIVLHDASRRDDVVFARVVPGRWRDGGEGKPPVHVLLIDFFDFTYVRGDRAARAAFDVGWALLHEIAHVAHGFDDPEGLHDLGECEALVNRMRRECGLAIRAEYFYTLLPGLERSEHKTAVVRLVFDEQTPQSGKWRRRWLTWDAAFVGGLNDRHRRGANTRFAPSKR